MFFESNIVVIILAFLVFVADHVFSSSPFSKPLLYAIKNITMDNKNNAYKHC